MGSFCEYRRTNDVKQKKQKTENNSTPKENQITMFHKQKKDNVLRYLKKDP